MENINYSSGINKKENIILLKLTYMRKEQLMSDINFEKDQEEILDRTTNLKSLANQVKILKELEDQVKIDDELFIIFIILFFNSFLFKFNTAPADPIKHSLSNNSKANL